MTSLDRSDAELRASLARNLAEAHTREDREYDGFHGLPPAWLPATQLTDFHSARERLCSVKFAGEDVTDSERLRWVQDAAENLDELANAACDAQYVRQRFIPLEVAEAAYSLARIWRAVQHGKASALAELVGPEAAAAARFRAHQQAAASADRPDALQQWIVDLLRTRGADLTWKEVLRAIESEAGTKHSPIVSCADDNIEFEATTGAIATAAVSGLKDRVSRARKRIKRDSL